MGQWSEDENFYVDVVVVQKSGKSGSFFVLSKQKLS